MRSTRREDLYLADILEAADAIGRFIDGVSLEEFVGNDMLRSAVLNKLQIIGEAAVHVGPQTRSASPHVPWREVVGFRNFTVHAYFAVDWDVVWNTATDDVPVIATAIRAIRGSGEGPL